MPLTPPRSTSGEITWSDTLTSTVKCSDVDASQEISVSIDHTLHVYYANARNATDAYPYYLIHRMTVEPSAGTLFSNTENVRGFITSSFRVGYRTLVVKRPNGEVIALKRIHQTPTASSETVETKLEGKIISIDADKGGGSTGAVNFEPTYRQVQQIPAWALEVSGNGSLPAWELYQTKPWSGRGVTDPGGESAKLDLLRQVFANSSPYGDIVVMPDLSRGTITCEFLTMWLVDRNMPATDRQASLTLGVGCEQRLTLFHNAKSKEEDAHRHTSVFTPDSTKLPDKVIALHEVARSPK